MLENSSQFCFCFSVSTNLKEKPEFTFRSFYTNFPLKFCAATNSPHRFATKGKQDVGSVCFSGILSSSFHPLTPSFHVRDGTHTDRELEEAEEEHEEQRAALCLRLFAALSAAWVRCMSRFMSVVACMWRC